LYDNHFFRYIFEIPEITAMNLSAAKAFGEKIKVVARDREIPR
jgi:hypothetical protein